MIQPWKNWEYIKSSPLWQGPSLDLPSWRLYVTRFPINRSTMGLALPWMVGPYRAYQELCSTRLPFLEGNYILVYVYLKMVLITWVEKNFLYTLTYKWFSFGKRKKLWRQFNVYDVSMEKYSSIFYMWILK